MKKDCPCYSCTLDVIEGEHPGMGMFLMPMVLCARCGNKRCPHATHHRNPCTESNEPGQLGSLYGPSVPRRRNREAR